MMKTWPTTIPQVSLRRGFSRQMGDARLRSRTDAGNGLMRRRLSVIPDPFTFVQNFSADQLATFEAFVNVEIEGGTKPFRMPAQDGRDAGNVWICQMGERMPAIEPIGKDKWQVTVQMVRLPQ